MHHQTFPSDDLVTENTGDALMQHPRQQFSPGLPAAAGDPACCIMRFRSAAKVLAKQGTPESHSVLALFMALELHTKCLSSGHLALSVQQPDPVLQKELLCFWLQVVQPELLRQGFEAMDREHFEVTDDVSIVEALGLPVKLTPGSETNIKVGHQVTPGVWR